MAMTEDLGATDKPNSDLLDAPVLWTAALKLARRGISVFPCHPKTKTPLVATGFKAATANPDTVRAWWSPRCPDRRADRR